MSDGVAGDAISAEQILPFIEILQRATVGNSLLLRRLGVLKIIEKVSDHPGLERWIIERGTADPLTDGLVADEQMGNVSVGVDRGVSIQAQSSAQENNVVFLSRQESPARPDIEFLHVSLQHFRRVMLGINADGIKEDVL